MFRLIKFCAGLVFVGMAGLGGFAFLEPEMVSGLLPPPATDAAFENAPKAEARAATAQSATPLHELILAQAAQAMLRSAAAARPDSPVTSAKRDAAKKQQITDAFFSDSPADPPADAPAESPSSAGMMSRFKIPFVSGDGQPQYQPIDHGAEIQSNPFITGGK
ncbi:MAG: hypothetical protein ACO1RT_01680 [Planctomycetaceae bacterium]